MAIDLIGQGAIHGQALSRTAGWAVAATAAGSRQFRAVVSAVVVVPCIGCACGALKFIVVIAKLAAASGKSCAGRCQQYRYMVLLLDDVGVVGANKKPRAGYRPGFLSFGRRPLRARLDTGSGAQAAK